MTFLSTARLAFFFDIASPSRAWFISFSTARMVKSRSLDRSGFLKTLLYSSGLSNRTCRLKHALSTVIKICLTMRYS